MITDDQSRSIYKPDNHIIGKAYDLTQENMCAMIAEIERLRAVEAKLKAALEVCGEYWFDPKSEGACSVCDCNLHENALGKHQQLNGEPCPFQLAHDALAELYPGEI